MLRALSSKRRLTVLQSSDVSDTSPRPRWHWVVFGALAIFAVWLPLAYVAQALSARLIDASLGNASPRALSALTATEQARMSFLPWGLPTAALGLAASGGGYVLGRWGDGPAGRQAAEAGAVAALLPIVSVWVTSGWTWASLGALVVAVPAATAGGRIGGRRRLAHAR